MKKKWLNFLTEEGEKMKLKVSRIVAIETLDGIISIYYDCFESLVVYKGTTGANYEEVNRLQ